MATKRIFTKKEQLYIIENYKFKTNTEMAEKLGLFKKSMYRILKGMGLKREEEDIKRVIRARKKSNNDQSYRRNIEGGGRSNMKAKNHKSVWIKKHGKIPSGFILVYKTPDYANYNDLVLIDRNDLDSFIMKRDKKMLESQKDKRRIERILKKEQKKNIAHQKELRRIENEKNRDREDEFLRSIKKNSNTKCMDKDRVPVQIDSRTMVWVKKEKCEKINGRWVLKKGERCSVLSFDEKLKELIEKEKNKLKIPRKKKDKGNVEFNDLIV